MYYPIIDKLKEVMEEIGQGGGGGHLVIEATATSQTGGTWVGNFSDIESAFANNTPVYCVVSAEGQKVMCALVSYLVPNISALCTPIPFSGNASVNIALYNDNTFALEIA